MAQKTTPKKKLTPAQLMHEDTIAQIEVNRKYLIRLEAQLGRDADNNVMSHLSVQMGFRKRVLEEFARIHQLLDLLLSANELKKEVEAHVAASPSLDKGKEWPKLYDLVVRKDRGKAPEGEVGEVVGVQVIHSKPQPVVSFFTGGMDGYWPEELREPTPSEIEAFEVSQEKGVLEILDACVCNPKQKADLIDMISGTGIPHVNDTIGPNMRWEDWYGKPSLVETCEPKEFNPHYKLNWLPFPLFKKKLQNTISAKKTEEEQREKLEAEKERNRVPEIGDRVEFADGGGPGFGHIATNGTDDALNYGIVVDRTGGSFDFILRTRNEFTILNP